MLKRERKELSMRVAVAAFCLLIVFVLPLRAEPAGERLIGDEKYAIVVDSHFTQRGPQAACGVIVWGHGLDERRRDLRSGPTQPYLRALNEAGYDIMRYERAPEWDGNGRLDEIVGFLRNSLIELRHRGWKSVIAAGQSRGGINSMLLLKSPGVVDAILAVSPALAGTDPGNVIMKGEVQFYEMLSDIPQQATRVMFVQFVGDPFAGDEDRRLRRVREMMAPQVGPVLVIDRPAGFKGHGAGNTQAFAARFGDCIAHFVIDPTPPSSCPAGP
jgi:pimeloyl-ACP methyl ester carboxylesterase